MAILKIDDKWSVEYDPSNNDRPTKALRYGEDSCYNITQWDNLQVAMFYALLEGRNDE